MNALLRADADKIIAASIRAVLPDEAVRRALEDYTPGEGRTLLVATGKAAWQMARAAVDTLGHVDGGVVVTKYDHVKAISPAWSVVRRATRYRMKTASLPPRRPLTWCPA